MDKILMVQSEEFKNELLEELGNMLDEKLSKRSKTESVEAPKFLSRAEACQLLKISLPTLGTLTKNGTLTGLRIGNRVLYDRESIFQAVEKGTINKYGRV